ncbi:MAG: hypothetical protein VX376_01950 [Pseudomonadota bacterium]|nr:hypothetical protein [Pseudomonadota bacterium]
MQDSHITEYIANLGGRRAYEEKRAAKLGFSSLYDYLEDKFTKKAQALAEEESKLSKFKSLRALPKTPKQSKNKPCGCC